MRREDKVDHEYRSYAVEVSSVGLTHVEIGGVSIQRIKDLRSWQVKLVEHESNTYAARR
jgi:hypothetical protein